MSDEPISFEPLSPEHSELYVQLVKRLHNLEFFVTLKFMDNEEKREAFAKGIGEWIVEFYKFSYQEFNFDCSPLCMSEQSECVPCEKLDPYKPKL